MAFNWSLVDASVGEDVRHYTQWDGTKIPWSARAIFSVTPIISESWWYRLAFTEIAVDIRRWWLVSFPPGTFLRLHLHHPRLARIFPTSSRFLDNPYFPPVMGSTYMSPIPFNSGGFLFNLFLGRQYCQVLSVYFLRPHPFWSVESILIRFEIGIGLTIGNAWNLQFGIQLIDEIIFVLPSPFALRFQQKIMVSIMGGWIICRRVGSSKLFRGHDHLNSLNDFYPVPQ